MSTHFLVTMLGKNKQAKIRSTSDMGSKGDDGDKGDRTDSFNQANINHPESVEELPEELKQQVEAKFNAVLKAFLESCVKDQ